MKKITILFGAGAEGKGQIGLPSGVEFKRDIILADKVASFANTFLQGTKFNIKNGLTITHNSHSILYQTIVESSKSSTNAMEILFPNPTERIRAQKYIQLQQNGQTDLPKKEIAFSKLYANFYNKIKKQTHDKSVEFFLEHAGIYSYLDSLFNHLRKPEEYISQCRRVIKIYYAALVSILNGMATILKDDSLPATALFNDMLNGKCTTTEPQKQLFEIIEAFEQRIVENSKKLSFEEQNKLYYYKMQQLATSKNHKLSCITTNYTTIAQRIIGIQEEQQFSYLHGQLKTFEELTTKHVTTVDKVNLYNTVFPYLLIPSGVKPIISSHQIREFNKACDMIEDADEMLIIGYGINSDDEHITNLLRERLLAQKSITIFVFSRDNTEREKAEKSIRNQLGNNNLLKFLDANNFSNFIDSLLHDNI